LPAGSGAFVGIGCQGGSVKRVVLCGACVVAGACTGCG